MPMTWLRLDSMMLLLVSLLLILVANTSACKANNPSLTTTTKDSKPLLPNLFPFIRSNASQPHKLTQIWDEMLNKTTDYYNEFCNYVEDYKNTYKLLEMKTWRWLGGKRGESFADSLEQSNTNLVMKDLSEARRIATEYLSLSSGSDWDVLGEEDDIMVWKANKLVEGSGSEAKKWPCIKAYTIIEAPADFLCNLLMDSSKVTLFNRYDITFASHSAICVTISSLFLTITISFLFLLSGILLVEMI